MFHVEHSQNLAAKKEHPSIMQSSLTPFQGELLEAMVLSVETLG
jgi:hypothetical protein